MNGEDRKQLERFEGILIQHGERLARIEEQNRNQYKMLKDIYKSLFGNGQEGLVKIVARHKAYFAVIGGVVSALAGLLGILLDKIF